MGVECGSVPSSEFFKDFNLEKVQVHFGHCSSQRASHCRFARDEKTTKSQDG